jgi:hypothetical protein
MPNPNWVFYVDRKTPAATKIQRAWRRRQERSQVGSSRLVRPRMTFTKLPPEMKTMIMEKLKPRKKVKGEVVDPKTAKEDKFRMTSWAEWESAVEALKRGASKGRGRRKKG